MKNAIYLLSSTTILVLFFFTACEKSNEPGNDSPVIHTIKTFEDMHHAFGEGLSQTAEGTFQFDVDPTKVERIRMYIKLRCPEAGCNAWDMYANVRIQNPATQDWLEMGRYITPYGVDNSQLTRGFMIDVTDFKSLLTGEVKLRSFIEVWGNDGWLVSIEFEVIEGDPDYKYYAVESILDYAEWSLAGVPYGEDHDFELNKQINIPANAEQANIRTIITGWGHATPVDPDGRPCAEWCFRTHHVLINNEYLFEHELGPEGCAENPVQPQNGNWAPDRAGWCPGMQVPVRTDQLPASMIGSTFSYDYEFEEWVNNFQTTADNKHAYYALSSFIVVKSNEPLEPPVVD